MIIDTNSANITFAATMSREDLHTINTWLTTTPTDTDTIPDAITQLAHQAPTPTDIHMYDSHNHLWKETPHD